MIDFIELNPQLIGDYPVMIRKSNVVAIMSHEYGATLYLNSGDMFHVKQSYDEIKEQFKFE